MNRREFLRQSAQTTALVAGLGLGAPAWAQDAATVAAKASADLPVLVLTGSPRARGRAHGEHFREKVQQFSEAWKAYMSAQVGAPAEAFVADFLANTRFDDAITRWTPELLPEMEGIAEGAGVDLAIIKAMNFPDEIRWYGEVKAAGLPMPELRGCTSLGFAGNSARPTIMGQNMDVASGAEGFEIFLHLKHEDGELESFIFSLAGFVAVIGMNNAPLGVCNNSLRQLGARPDGLPINCIVRGVLAQKSAEEAVRFVQEVPHASGQNWMIGGPETVRTFECSAAGAVEFASAERPGVVYHTNHPYVSKDTAMFKPIRDMEASMQEGPSSSEARHAVVIKTLQQMPETVDAAYLQGILSSREDSALPICRPHRADNPGETYTAASVVYELSVPPVLHLAPGPPSETAYKTYRF